MSESREFDIVVFGATGFTGQYVVEELARTAQHEHIKWAVSGRNLQKLSQVLATVSAETGIDIKNIATIEADVQSDESLRSMTARTRLVLNTVGPHRLFGEQVVKACVETATNHLDISGEPQYIETMQLKYNKAAKDKGIYIASACGWDSIPVDLGVQFLKKHFDGEVNGIETYLTVKYNLLNGMKTNYGTWHSAIEEMATQSQLKDIRRQLSREVFTKQRPQSKFKLQRKYLPFKSEYTRGWCLLFPGDDRSVVQRTQQYRYETLNERPTQIETYFTVPNFITLVGVLFFGGLFVTMTSFRLGRYLLKRYPELFTFGFFSRVGPTREQIMDTSFRTIIVGKGWTDKLTEPTDEHQEPPNKTMVVSVTGQDPAYRATSTCLVQSGVTFIKDFDKLPKNGGVFTAGALFDGTVIYERLKAHHMIIEVVNG